MRNFSISKVNEDFMKGEWVLANSNTNTPVFVRRIKTVGDVSYCILTSDISENGDVYHHFARFKLTGDYWISNEDVNVESRELIVDGSTTEEERAVFKIIGERDKQHIGRTLDGLGVERIDDITPHTFEYDESYYDSWKIITTVVDYFWDEYGADESVYFLAVAKEGDKEYLIWICPDELTKITVDTNHPKPVPIATLDKVNGCLFANEKGIHFICADFYAPGRFITIITFNGSRTYGRTILFREFAKELFNSVILNETNIFDKYLQQTQELFNILKFNMDGIRGSLVLSPNKHLVFVSDAMENGAEIISLRTIKSLTLALKKKNKEEIKWAY